MFLGGWFLSQLVEGNSGLVATNASGAAFFAHVGGFLFGVVVARPAASAIAREPAGATT